ncbi:MAG: HD domain-containing protein, partial [Pseudomonadota bacterium]
MITADQLVDLIKAYNPTTDEARLRRAYDIGQVAHDGQWRSSGEPYFSHPIEVAALLTEQRLDDTTIITALLHDTIEDTKVTIENLASAFDHEIAGLVDGVTKLTNLQLSSVETKQAENFRKLLMAIARDPRVLLVKLADRLHNMRTIRYLAQTKQVQKARET